MNIEILKGFEELKKEYCFKDNITATKGGSGVSVSIDGADVKISYEREIDFFRGLGMLLKMRIDGEKSKSQKSLFESLTLMVDNSRNAVMTVEANKKLIRMLALMGYNRFMLYTEDTYEVNNNPLFGHKRGRYSKAEMREINDYAKLFGIEVIPCIQVLAHLNGISIYNTYDKFIDIKDILLVGAEETYELIDNMFATTRECFDTDIIHIGMDESEMIGRGKYCSKNGFESSLDIIRKHLDKVLEIAKKHGYKPMMWSDMFFKLPVGGEPYYYDNEFRPEMKESVPDGLSLVYWDYYAYAKDHYDRIMEKHLKFEKPLLFAGGVWNWMGFAPLNYHGMNNTRAAMDSAIEHGIQHFMTTAWGDDGGECPVFSVLPAVHYTAERAYGITDEEEVAKSFKAIVGVEKQDFLTLDLPNQLRGLKIVNTNASKYMFYNDYFNGVMDATVVLGDAEHYVEAIKKLKAVEEKGGEWQYLFSTMRALCEVLVDKFEIGVKTRNAYLAGDKKTLNSLVENEYVRILAKIKEFYKLYRTQWYKINKLCGFDVQDIRIGGMICRTENCINTLKEYLDGTIKEIPEISEQCYDYFENLGDYEKIPLSVNNWKRTFSANVM